MKKEKILRMTKEELLKERNKISDKLYCSNCPYCPHCSNCFNCSNCSNCYDCSYCSYCTECSCCSNCTDCFDCSDCSYCKNQIGKKYMIANVQFTKEEYEKWKRKKV